MDNATKKLNKQIERAKEYIDLAKEKILLPAIKDEVELYAKAFYVNAGRSTTGAPTQAWEETLKEYILQARHPIDPNTLGDFIRDNFTEEQRLEWFLQGRDAGNDYLTAEQEKVQELEELGFTDLDTAIERGTILKPTIVNQDGQPIL